MDVSQRRGAKIFGCICKLRGVAKILDRWLFVLSFLSEGGGAKHFGCVLKEGHQRGDHGFSVGEPSYNFNGGQALSLPLAQKRNGRDRIYILGARIFVCGGENSDVPRCRRREILGAPCRKRKIQSLLSKRGHTFWTRCKGGGKNI